MTEEAFEGPDLIVAGAGGGLIAALRAAQVGLSVLVVEANAHFRRGNNTSMSTAMIPGAGSRWQEAAGIDDSPENFVKDIVAKTRGEADLVLATALANVSPRLVEWMADDLKMPMSLVTDFPYPGHSSFRCHTVPGRIGTVLMDLLLAEVRKSDLIDLYVPARVIDVLMTEGAVSGVKVRTPEGIEEIPTRAVLLATNGFGANPKLIEQNIPEIKAAIYHGSEESVGDALNIGTGLGAATAFLDAYQGHAALAMPSVTLAGWSTVMHGGFLVNKAGKRFGNETIGYSEYARESLAHADGQAWIIIDERIKDACQVFQDFLDTEASGGIHWADNVTELAAVTGVDAAGLEATLSATRQCAESFAEDEFGRLYWEAPLNPEKLGAIAVRPALFHTQGGLKVDGHARVLTETGNAIHGLYASGGAAMGISGHGAGGYLAGNGLLPALGLAFLAAEDIATTRERS